MADLIKVNTGRLTSDASEIRKHIAGIRKKIEELRTHNIILDSMWDGPGSEAFKTAFESDIAALEAMLGSLEVMNGYEENAGRKYDECESKVADLVDQIKVG